jgi:hypothetical protein
LERCFLVDRNVEQRPEVSLHLRYSPVAYHALVADPRITHNLVVVDAADMIGKLNLQFNRARQGKITGELIEIITVSSRPASYTGHGYSVLVDKVETGRD